MQPITHICGKNSNRLLVFHSRNGKHFSRTLVLISFILFGSYVCFYRRVTINRSSETKLYVQSNRWQSSTLVESYSKTRNAVDIIRDVLDAEYNRQDLLNFYSLVEKRLTLGVQCAKAKSDIKVNVVNVPSNNLNTTISLKDR
jgi:hypothetical protein